MQDETVAYLDLTNCASLHDLHERLRKAFNFPDWYGCSWSALYDLMRTDTAAETLYITGQCTIPSHMQHHIDMMHQILRDIDQHFMEVWGTHFAVKVLS